MSKIEPVAWMHPAIKGLLHADEKSAIISCRRNGRWFESSARNAENYTVPLYTAPPDTSALQARIAKLEAALNEIIALLPRGRLAAGIAEIAKKALEGS